MRVGLVNGCFDVLHDGHRHFLREAWRLCDWLVIGINTDESVQRLKGAERPAEPLLRRRMKLARYGDATLPFDGDVLGLIRFVNPVLLIRGADQSTLGAEMVPVFIQIPRWGSISTTSILEARKCISHSAGFGG